MAQYKNKRRLIRWKIFWKNVRKEIIDSIYPYETMYV